MLACMHWLSLARKAPHLLRSGSLILFLLCGFGGQGQTLTDDFSGYKNGSDAGPAWEPQALGWTVVDGAYQGEDGASLWRRASWASAVRFSCDVTVLKELPGEWLTAGIGLQMDDENYWALHLVTAPEERQRKHTTEMQEMLNGTWLAQYQAGTTLKSLPGHGSGFDWQIGQTYRLELDLNSSNIVGRILHDRKEVSRFGFHHAANVPAVRVGRPVVRASGLLARFDNATLTVTSREQPPKPASRIAPWVSLPGTPLSPGTGFFRTLEVDGRWWLLDPEGKPFFGVGTDHASYRGHWCEALGYSPYNRNVAAKYGGEQGWSDATLARLKSWGFNTLPAGHSLSLRHRGLAHIEFASFGTSFAKREWICQPIHWTGFPDVFSPNWEAHCRIIARKFTARSKDDPWCIGTFLDNELEWYGKKGHLVDEVFQISPERPAKKAFYDWLVERFGSLAKLNGQCRTTYPNEAGFLSSTNVPPFTPALDRVRKEFLSVIAERYFSVASGAMRAADPDHLVLGCRFAGDVPEPVLAAAAKYNDVFTINTYPQVDFESAWLPDGTGGVVERVPQQLTSIYEHVRKPMIITEWSFPALDSGLPCKYGAGMRVDTQEQKAACYRIFANMAADLPFMVGYHYFMWADEPALGISSTFPEDSNYGLVNEQDEPYPLLTKVTTEVNKQTAQRHALSRSSGPLSIASSRDYIELANTNLSESHGHLLRTAKGKTSVEQVRLKAGERRRFEMPSDTAWAAELQSWDGAKHRVLGGHLRPETFTILNAGTKPVSRVPVLLENSDVVIGTVLSLAPGETAGIDPGANKLERRRRSVFRGTETTWTCTGETGALFDRIESGGLSLGRLVFAVHQKVNGQSYWVESARITTLETTEQPDAWVVEAQVEAPPTTSGPAGYRARVRAVVFKNYGLAMVRPLWVENLDAREWQLIEAYWFCRSEIGGSRAGDVVGGPQVPGYYRRAQFITDSEFGGCFGALGQLGAWQVTFWTNPQGGIHPDSRFTVDQLMSPAKRWEAGFMPYLWVYASSRHDAWKEFATMHQQSTRAICIATKPDLE
jgi:hypothetical protein